jgi:hypothetical protein
MLKQVPPLPVQSEMEMASYGSKTLSSGLGGAIAARCCRLLNRAHKTRKDHAEEQR